MTRYLLQRVAQAVALLFLLSLGFFALIHALPGGPDAVLRDPRLTGAARAALRRKYGLDAPLPIQYVAWISALLKGDFGNSFVSGEPVLAEIAGRVPATVELLVTALVVALAVAVPTGIIAAAKQYSLTDQLATLAAYTGISMPVFWFSLMLQIVFGVLLHVLPTFGRTGPNTADSPLGALLDQLQHLILPCLTLVFPYAATWSRYLRSSMLDVLQQDYVRAAYAKGLRARGVLLRHALRNALNPLVTQVAIDCGSIFGGAVITETIFGWPGLGRLFYDSVTSRDYPILLAMLLLGSVAVVIFNLLADVLYVIVDPRIKYR